MPGGVLHDLKSALDRLTRPPLLGLVAGGMLVLLLGVVGVHLYQLEEPSAGRIDIGTGDFMAFWTGAVFLHEGRGAELYQYSSQQEVQAGLLGGKAPEFQPYLNPPLLAVMLSPLVPFGYLTAFYLYDFVSLLCLGVGISALLALTPAIRAQPGGLWAAIFVIAGFQPMLETTLGGQNTAITFALLSTLTLAIHRGAAWPAAVLLGLLTYKPQYAVGAGAALLMARQWKVLGGGALGGLLHYALGAWWCGATWPLRMLAFMQAYRPLEISNNAETHFSWVRTADFLLPSPVDSLVGLLGVLAVLAAWWRFRDLILTDSAVWMSLVVTGTMLASPHQQYYDVALLVLPAGLLLDRQLARASEISLPRRLALALAWVGYPMWRCAESLHVQPLFLVLLGVAAWSLNQARQAAAGSRDGTGGGSSLVEPGAPF